MPGPLAKFWPTWAPRAATGIGFAHATFLFGVIGFGAQLPYKPESNYPSGALVAFAVFHLLASACALASAGNAFSCGRRRALLTVLWSAAVVDLLLTFGLVQNAVAIAAGDTRTDWLGVLNELGNAAGAGLLIATAIAYGRRTRGACPRSGRVHSARSSTVRYPPPTTAPRRTRRVALVCTAGVLPWAVVKTIWALGGSALGVAAAEWEEHNADASSITKHWRTSVSTSRFSRPSSEWRSPRPCSTPGAR